MSFERLSAKELPSREGVRSAIEVNPDFVVLLSQVEGLSKEAYSALDGLVNFNKITFNDFALYEEDGKDLVVIANLLQRLEEAGSDEERLLLVGQIADALS